MSIHQTTDSLSIVIRKKLPKDAQEVFIKAYNDEVDRLSGDANNTEYYVDTESLVAGWAAVKKGWRQSDRPGEKWVKRPKHVEKSEAVDKNEDNDMSDVNTGAEVIKVDESLGLVFGWAIVCTENGEPYFDKNLDALGQPSPDHIPEDEMLKASVDFMLSDRVSGDMHKRDADGAPVKDGTVVFMMPMTGDIAKSYGIETDKTGLMIAIKPSPDVLAKFASGEFTGFSIGGNGKREEM